MLKNKKVSGNLLFLKSKKGLTTQIITSAIIALIVLIVLFQIYATVVPTAQTAGDSLGDATACTNAGGFFNTTQSACLNGTGPADTGTVNFSSIPLSGLFAGTGVVFVIVIAALIILVIKAIIDKR